MRFVVSLIFIFFQLSFINSAAAQTSIRSKFNFNSDWKLYVGDNEHASAPNFDDKAWQTVTLPHAWNEDAAFKVPIDSLPTGISWYRKHFKLPPGTNGRKFFIEFEGIRMGGDVYLNGTLLGTHENGVMAFGFDITDLVKQNEDNVFALRIDNSWKYREKKTGSGFQWNDHNFNANYGGINKNVWLHITDKLYQTLPLYSFLQTTGTYVYARDFDIAGKAAIIVVDAQVKNEYASAKKVSLEVEIKDIEGKIVKKFSAKPISLPAGGMQSLNAAERVNGLNFWSWGYGYLYTVTSRLLVDDKPVDEVKTVTGFRKTEFKNGMVYLNDRVIMVHGYAQRSTNEWPAVGSCVPAWMSDFSNRLVLESNGNLIRWMHVTPWKQDIESCDRLGIMQAMPAGDAEKDVTGRRWEQRTELMRDAIVYNRNNPSIIFYECGNESISAEHMVAMKQIRDQYDPYGGRAIGSREMLDIPEAEYGGEMLYINKSATKPVWAMEYARDEALRKYWDDYTPPYHKNGVGPLYKGQDASNYNKNQDVFAIDAVKQWYDYWSVRPGTGDRVSSGGVNIVFSNSNTHFRGEQNFRNSGEVDAMRLPKDAFYAHQVMWDGWVDPDVSGLHIIGHWNYDAGTKKDIYVVSSGDKVELLLNGKSLGFGERSFHFLFTFANVTFAPGTLTAVSYDSAGKKLASSQLVTAGKPVALRMKTYQHPDGLHADGADLALAEVEVVDAKGNRCPTALNMVDFSLDGPAEWRGGIAQGAHNYILSKSLPVECGVNRVIIRALNKAGKVTLKASSDGLKGAIVSWDTKPVVEKNGLAIWMPSDGLPSDLDRGATPKGVSYKITRKSLHIKTVDAGANADKALFSYDDNELSDWVNDGNIATAWIKYTLDKPAEINAVELKLNKFRSKSYPLIIMVDDKIAYEGPSKTGLGYYVQNFAPVKGSSVTIKMGNAQAATDNGIDIGLEVTGKKLDDGVEHDSKNQKGTLSIIEADIYGEP